MQIDPRNKAKLRRIIGYASTAAIAAWSLLALAAYAGIEAALEWLLGIIPANRWLVSLVQTSAAFDGPAIAIVWLIGAGVLAGLALLMRRLTASRG